MQAKWLVEEDAFPEDTSPLLKSLIDRRVEFATIKSNSYFEVEDTFLSIFDPDDCVIFYGSLGMAKRIRKKARWVPGVYYNIDAYNCTNYYAALGKYLLNEDYIMLPWGDLLRQKEFLYKHLSSDRAIFIRPNRGDKIFTGQVLYKEDFEKTIGRLNMTNFGNEELVVVSSPCNIQFEWRIVIVRDKVIAGSQYRKNEQVMSSPSYPPGAAFLAEEVAKVYAPDDVFVVDVCLVNDQYRVMEVGCFSCAGLYECYRDSIVVAVSDVAEKEWHSYRT